MIRSICVALTVAAISVCAAACSSDAHNEGNACAAVDDCGGNLSCQPITGRKGNFCCPTPPDSSSEGNCHAQ